MVCFFATPCNWSIWHIFFLDVHVLTTAHHTPWRNLAWSKKARLALCLVLQQSISAPSMLCCTWGRDAFLKRSVCGFHHCIYSLCPFVPCSFLELVVLLLLLQCYLAVLNNFTPSCYIILAPHTNGILSQSVTTHNNLFFVCDFLKCFLSKVKSFRHDWGLIRSIYQETWRLGGGFFSNFHIVFFK